MRAAARGPVSVGLAENPAIPCPLIETPANIEAAKKAMRRLNARYLTAVMEGAYLPSYLEELGADAPAFTEAEMKTIAAPLDFLGCNMYAPTYVEAADNEAGFREVPVSPAHPRFEFDWLSFGPEITYWAPRLAAELWGVKAFYITENGCSTPDTPDLDGQVNDTGRVAYLRAHFQSAARAVAEGYPLKGYFVWSLLDNFEWAYGYTRRFGLIHVNYSSLKRTPKLSYQWYRELIRHRRLV